MFDRKFMILAIFLVSLLAVSAVSAADNATGDIVNVESNIDDVEVEQVADTSFVDELAKSDENNDSLEVTGEDFNVTIVNDEVEITDEDAVIISFTWPEEAQQQDTIGVAIGDQYPFNFIKSENVGLQTITFGDLYIFEEGSYNFTVSFFKDADSSTFPLAAGTLKVTKQYKDTDFIELYDKTITDPDDYVTIVHDSTESGLNGNVTIYAGDSLVFSRQFTSGTNEGQKIYARDLSGTDGAYSVRVVYKKANGKEYSMTKAITFVNVFTLHNGTPFIPHIDFNFTGDVNTTTNQPDFNVVIVNDEVDLNHDDGETVIISFSWPEEVGYADQIILDIEDRSPHNFYKYGFDSQNITFGELYIFEQGDYGFTLSFFNNTDKSTLQLANGTLKVTKIYGADDFIELDAKTINDSADCVAIVHDPTESGLNGNVSIYAGDVLVFSREFTSGTNEDQMIYARDLDGADGEYSVRVVYKKANGKEYSMTKTISFVNVFTLHNGTPFIPHIDYNFTGDDNTTADLPDFNVVIVNDEVDIADEDAVIISFTWPEEVRLGDSVVVSIGGASLTCDAEAAGTSRNVTLGELLIIEPGSYDFTVTFFNNTDKSTLQLANGTLKVTKTYVADDFILLDAKTIDDPADYVTIVYDPTGLNGTVTVYANNKLVFTKKYSSGTYDGKSIDAKDLSNMENKKYDIKVVYTKANGTSYSKTVKISFANVYLFKTSITVSSPTVVFYGEDKYATATLYSGTQKLKNVYVTITANGVSYKIQTDKYGQIKQSLASFAPGKRTIKFTFQKSGQYLASTKSVTVTVKKATPKFTAAAKAFKLADKTKKYVVTLKTNMNKPFANAMLYITVNGVKYSAKTNAKGQATFKLTKLKKVGSFSAALSFNGNTYYNKISKAVKITVKK